MTTTGKLRRDTPPRVGPYGRAEQVGGRWVVRLNDEGRRVVTDWLATVNNLVGYFAGCHPATLRLAVAARMTEDEIDAACRRGAARAAAKWRPGGEAYPSVAVRWMRSEVQREAFTLTKCFRQTGQPEGDVFAETIPAGGERESRHDNRDERKRLVLEELRRMPERDRLIFGMVYGLGGGEPMTLLEVAAVYGLTKQRVHQVCERVKSRLAWIVGGAA